MVGNVLRVYFPQFKLGRKEAIFGDINTAPDSVINTMLLLAKQYIWKQKFGSKTLDEISFKIYMKNELNFLYQTKDLFYSTSPQTGWGLFFQPNSRGLVETRPIQAQNVAVAALICERYEVG